MKKNRLMAVLLAACVMTGSMTVCADENSTVATNLNQVTAETTTSGDTAQTIDSANAQAPTVAVDPAEELLNQARAAAAAKGYDLTQYHTINVLGDSITEGVGATDKSKSFPTILAKLTGAKVNNYGLSCSRITDVPANVSSFVDRVYNMDGSADLVIVFGGTNDFWNGDCPIGHPNDKQTNTFNGALNTMMTYLKNAFPHADIVFITPYQQSKGADETHGYKTSTYGNFGTGTLKEYRNAIIDRAEHHGIPVLDLYSDYELNTVDNEEALKNYGHYLCDGCHLNDAGYNFLAREIYGFVMQDLKSYVPGATYVNGMEFETAALPALINGNGFDMPNGSYIPVTNGVEITPEMDLKTLYVCLMQSI